MTNIWDLRAQWGSAPLVNGAQSAGSTSLSVDSLGTGTLPSGSTFTLDGVRYVLTADAVISSGAATFTIDPVLAADAVDNSPLTETNLLCSDIDLSEQESEMPNQGQKVNSKTGKTPYDGKRKLVKQDIASWLRKRGYDVNGLTNPWQLTRAAVFYELHYIYRDMTVRENSTYAAKRDQYFAQFTDEMDSLAVSYEAAGAAAAESTTREPLMISWRRA